MIFESLTRVLRHSNRFSPSSVLRAGIPPCDGFRKGLWETLAMWADSEGLIVGLSWLVQLIGVCGVTAARLRSDRHSRQKCDWFVLLCFAVVGTVSALLMGQCNGCGLAIATTMPLMAVGATLDLKKVPRAAPF